MTLRRDLIKLARGKTLLFGKLLLLMCSLFVVVLTAPGVSPYMGRCVRLFVGFRACIISSLAKIKSGSLYQFTALFVTEPLFLSSRV